jgi:hypothetical protein
MADFFNQKPLLLTVCLNLAMAVFKRIFDFYIRSSIHVALSVYALARMTNHMFDISDNLPIANFAFFGTIVGYNFVKYDALARTGKAKISLSLKVIATLSFLSFLAAVYFFFQLQLITQLVSAAVLALTLLYTLPFFPNRRNARNWAGVKIYIVSMCWTGVTVVLPVLNAEIGITSDFYLKCIQRFILVFVLILIFEIIDLSKDDPHLQTVPQQIGVKRTKILGVCLLIVLYCLEFLRMEVSVLQLAANFVLFILVVLFLLLATPNRSKYYTSFWVEGIPVVWFALILAADNW